MASNSAAVPPLSELSGVIEELRRQMASASDAQVATEVGHHHQTVLSNIMLTGEETGQVAPPEDLENGSGATKTTAISPVSNLKNGTDHNISADPQTAPPTSVQDQIPGGPDFISHHNQAPFNGQILTPDVHLTQGVQLAAMPQPQAEQFTRAEPQTAIVDTVDINDAPVAVVPIANQSTDEDAGFSFTVPANSFIDLDAGDTLTLSATLADGSPLPAWLSFDPGTQTFSGTPLNDDVGSLIIRVTATDTAGATATQDFQVTVNNTNDGPVASAVIANQSTDEDAGFSFTVPPASFSDVDVGDTLIFSATLADGSPLPAWLTFDPVSQTFSGTPLNEDVGALSIRVNATDTAGASASQDFIVTVNNTNDGPFASATITNQSTDEDAGFSFTVPAASFVDVDVGDTITLSATLADGSALPAWLSFDPVTQTFSGTPLNDDVGSLTIMVTATDTAGASAAQEFTVTVANVNDAPVASVTIASQSTNEDAGFSFTVPPASFTDVDVGDTLTLSATLADGSPLPAWLSFDPGTQTFSGTPLNDDVDSLSIRVTATDTAGATATQDFQVTVNNTNDAPVITSSGTASFGENATGTVYTAAATDVDAGTTLTYSISGVDAALFNIDSASGAVTFKSSPNFEAPADAGANNVYDITVGASDGTVTTTKDVAISVTNVNEAPTITSGAAASFAENKTGTVYTVAATDPDAGTTLTYSLTGTDAARFNINATTGAITFKSRPNYEAPTDAGKDNVYDVTVRASDGANITTKAVAITVTNVNEAPVITSAATASFAENGTGTVYTATATDPDAGTTLTYSLAGTDAAKFNIDATTGAVTFKSSPNYEAPTDSGANNVYNVTVRASDGALTRSKAVAITVTNVNEAPTVTSAATASFAENATGTIYTASATDPDAGSSLTYSISGADASLFDINATTGAVTFKSAPNYEAPADAGGNNVYDVNVTASDGSLSSTKAVAITVTNVNEAPTVTSAATASFAENATGTVYTASATDPDSGTALTYSISGADASLFNIDAITGAVTFKSSPNYENPDDAGGDNVYDVKVTASDGTVTATKDVAITVTNVNESPTASAAIADQSTNEDAGFSFTVPANSFIDVDAGDTLTLSATLADGSPLPAWLSFDPGTQTFSGTPLNDDVGSLIIRVTATDTAGATAMQDFTVTVANTNDGPVAAVTIANQSTDEDAGFSFTVPAASFSDVDAGDTLTLSATLADGSALPAWLSFDPVTRTFSGTPLNDDVGSLTIMVTATDTAGATATQDFAVTVNNTNDAPVITSSGTASFAENATGTVYTATATDVDAGSTLTYSISGADASLFNIDATTGAVTFKSSPNHENPNDAGGDNVYDVNVTASDGTNSATKAVAITVTNVNEDPVVTSATTASFAENATGTVYTAAATDPDAGTTLTYSISGADASLFNIDATTGAVTFKSSPNYETPTDAGGNNVYDINVTASDGSLSSTKAVALSVTNVNEAPTGITVTGPLSVQETVVSGGTIGTAFNPGVVQPVVATLAASDPEGDSVTYALVGAPAGLFAINGNQIKVAPGATFDYETTPSYDLTVRATDSEGNIFDQAVTINITNYAGTYTGNPGYNTATGTSEEDIMDGGAGNDTLYGGGGNDTIFGGAGNDTLWGGSGNDTLNGGAGADLFMIQAGLGNDTVTGGAGGSWIDAISLLDGSGNSYSGAFPTDWTLVLTSGSITSTGSESLTLSTDSSGYVQHTDGTQVNFTEIEQIRW